MPPVAEILIERYDNKDTKVYVKRADGRIRSYKPGYCALRRLNHALKGKPRCGMFLHPVEVQIRWEFYGEAVPQTAEG